VACDWAATGNARITLAASDATGRRPERIENMVDCPLCEACKREFACVE